MSGAAHQRFRSAAVQPVLQFPSPLLVRKPVTTPRGKQHAIYRYEAILTHANQHKSPPKVKDYLKPGVSFEILGRIDRRTSDNPVADQLQKARRIPFKTIHGQTLKRRLTDTPLTRTTDSFMDWNIVQ
jgi:hypothetical protein